MSEDEVVAFAANPWAQDALLLRQRDDAGKNPDHAVTDIQFYRGTLERVAASHMQEKDHPRP